VSTNGTRLTPAQGWVPSAAIGQASGTLNTLRQLGAVFGVAICAAVFAARGRYAMPATFVAGFGVPVQTHPPKIESRR
jgi:hypothetical protein